MTVTIRVGGSGSGKGGAVMASQGPMTLMGLIFGPQGYSNEKMAFNGQKLTLGELHSGARASEVFCSLTMSFSRRIARRHPVNRLAFDDATGVKRRSGI